MSRNYWDWIKTCAEAVKTDGCSGVPDFHVECCWEHDLAYRTGKDPREAFVSSWASAPALEENEADKRFRQCIQSRSKLGRFSPMSWWRWAAVRVTKMYHPAPVQEANVKLLDELELSEVIIVTD